MRIRTFAAMEGVYVLTPDVVSDARGRLISAYDYHQLAEIEGVIDSPFIHSDIYFLIARGLVGLYYQESNPRASLYRCLYGRAQIVAVDLREGSQSFGKFQQVILDSEQCFGFLTKPGFATGCVGVNGPATVYVEHSTRADIHDQKVLWAGLQGQPILGTREMRGVTIDKIRAFRPTGHESDY
jgi:dTDP-4-dehydrorhamnose 3,5-epimerase